MKRSSMQSFAAFLKKEFLEQIRTGKLYLLLVLFVLFGVMNPAIAKLSPWMMEQLSGSLEETGIVVTAVKVDAMTSWTQFYKNVPIALAVFVLLFGGVLTMEYQKGTLINMLTKGLKRWQVVWAKEVMMCTLWTLGYWMCYGITYGYNAYFWDNSVASHVFLSAFGIYLLGLWLISLVMLFSTLCHASGTVVLATGGTFLGSYLLGVFPDVKEYVPTRLFNSMQLLTKTSEASDYRMAIIMTAVLIVANGTAAVILFNKKSI